MIGLIAGMVAVTYGPRLIPFLLLRGAAPTVVRRYLRYLPAAALGALVVPGAFEAVPESTFASIAGLTAALIAAWTTRSLILAVVCAAGCAWLVLTAGL